MALTSPSVGAGEGEGNRESGLGRQRSVATIAAARLGVWSFVRTLRVKKGGRIGPMIGSSCHLPRLIIDNAGNGCRGSVDAPTAGEKGGLAVR